MRVRRELEKAMRVLGRAVPLRERNFMRAVLQTTN